MINITISPNLASKFNLELLNLLCIKVTKCLVLNQGLVASRKISEDTTIRKIYFLHRLFKKVRIYQLQYFNVLFHVYCKGPRK